MKSMCISIHTRWYMEKYKNKINQKYIENAYFKINISLAQSNTDAIDNFTLSYNFL